MGFVYVITTHLYQKENIYKIGCAFNIETRLKEFNKTRILSDTFFIVHFWETVNYFRLESYIHNKLKSDRLNNELFKIINFKQFKDEVDQEYKPLIQKHLEISIEYMKQNSIYWCKDNNYFIEKHLIYNQNVFIDKIKKKLYEKKHNKFNLNKFLSDNHWNLLLSNIKMIENIENLFEKKLIIK